MVDIDQSSLPTVDKLKRKRATQRAHATRFMNAINTFDDSTDIEELEQYRDRLPEVLQNLIVLEESVHDLLDDEEYAADAKSEELVDGAKRAVRKADRIIKDKRGETVSYTTSKSHNTTHNPR